MNQGVLQSAKAYVKDGKFTEGALNRIEAVIRTYDPCLSCSTHALGQMPLHIQLLGSEGQLLDEVKR
jgi:NAD-reducing hydrogenase large subunit